MIHNACPAREMLVGRPGGAIRDQCCPPSPVYSVAVGPIV